MRSQGSRATCGFVINRAGRASYVVGTVVNFTLLRPLCLPTLAVGPGALVAYFLELVGPRNGKMLVGDFYYLCSVVRVREGQIRDQLAARTIALFSLAEPSNRLG